MLTEGEILGPYTIRKRIRGGGMATLFLAERGGARGFARHLAIKVVNEDLAQDDVFVEMFIDEAKLAAQINHPNVVHVEDFGEADGKFFIAMEYIHGCSLAQLLRALVKQKRRLTPELAVYIAVKVSEGLHAAHEAVGHSGASLQVVHRDVNPANVLMAYKGHVKLIDFGIAKSSSRAHQTTGGSLKGKLRYMSPEQAMGKDIDRRADVYSLGVTLWETLTARRLFDAQTDIQVLDAVRNPHVEPPSRYAEDVSPALDAVVMAALNPSLDARTPTALELRKQLTRALPEAAMLESSSLSELLSIVMRDDIEKNRAKLPDSLAGGAKAAPAPGDDDILRTMTVSDVAIETSESLEPTSVSNSIPGDPSPPQAPPPVQADSVALAGPPGPPLSRPLGTPANADITLPPNRRWPVVVGAGALLGLVLGVVVYAVGTSGGQTIEAVPLDDGVALEPADLAAPADAALGSSPGDASLGDAGSPSDSVAVISPAADAGPTDARADQGSVSALGGQEPDVSSMAAETRPRRPDRIRPPRMTMARRDVEPREVTPMRRSGAPGLVEDVF